MYYEAFSRNVNEVIEYANTLAKRFGCRYIGSEHIMFGLINVSDGRAASILREAEVDNDRYLYYFKKTIDVNAVIPGNMFTPRTKRHFEKAIDISLRAHSGFVGTEHLLLAILLDDEAVATAILKAMQVNTEAMAEEIAESLFGEEEQDGEQESDGVFANTFRTAHPGPSSTR